MINTKNKYSLFYHWYDDYKEALLSVKDVRKLKADTLNCEIVTTEISTPDGRSFVANFNITKLRNKVNTDCFNCINSCCGELPGKLPEKSIEYLKENSERFNSVTGMLDMLKDDETGFDMYSYNAQDSEIDPDFGCGCPLSCVNKNNSKVCGLHSMLIEDELDVVSHKPLICNIYPIMAFIDTITEEVYITLNTSELNVYLNYTPCSNEKDYNTAKFKRTYPNFSNNYRKVTDVYENEIKYTFGEKVLETLKAYNI